MALHLVLALATLLPAPPGTVDVRTDAGGLQVRATTAPAAEVLNQLGRYLHMQVRFEGGAPSQLISVALSGRTPADTVLGVLEGLGLTYVLKMDAKGTGAESLVVIGGAESAKPAPVASPPPFRPRMPDPEPAEAEEPSVPSEESGVPPPDTSAGMGFVPGAQKPPPVREAPVVPGAIRPLELPTRDKQPGEIPPPNP